MPPAFAFKPVRTALLHELESIGAKRKVICVVAPIGYGKTVLMTQWHAHLQSLGRRCIWAGFDEQDSTLRRALQRLQTALSVTEGAAHPAHAMFEGNAGPSPSVGRLLESLSRFEGPTTLFLDNVSACREPGFAAVLKSLCFETREDIHIVFSGTEWPTTDLVRLKLQGHIAQLGIENLALNLEETREVIGSDLARKIGETGMQTILRKTEGWPAAIRMVQIVLAESDRPSARLAEFSGSDEDIAALLNRQLLQSLPGRLREFLLRVALLGVFTPELCKHVTGFRDSHALLEDLMRRNALVIPLDRNQRRYRLHAIFRQFLVREGTRDLDEDTRRETLKRAADWCETHAEWNDAIAYALASKEYAAAGRLLERTAEIFLRDRGDFEQFIEWAEDLTGHGIQIGWQVHFWYVFALVLRRRCEQARAQHEALQDRLVEFRGPVGLPPRGFEQRIEYLRLCLDLFSDSLARVEQAADTWLAGDPPEDRWNIASVHCIKSCALASDFKFALVRQSMRVAEPIMRELSGAYSEGWIRLVYATVHIFEGDFPKAQTELGLARRKVDEELGSDSILSDTLSFLAAKCAVEMGDDDEALVHFRKGLRTAQVHGLVDFAACGFDAGVKLWTGTDSDAVSVAQLRQIAGSYPPRLARMLACFLVRRFIRLGRTQDALIEAAHIGLLESDPVANSLDKSSETARYRDLWNAARLELQLACGRVKRADREVSRQLSQALAESRSDRAIELRLLLATLYLQSNNPKAARKQLVAAILSGAPLKLVRIFRDHAETVVLLVADTKPAQWPFVTAEQRQFFSTVCAELPAPELETVQPGAARAVVQGSEITPTRREIELLQLAHGGMSSEQIADHVDASLNTVRWHFKNIYRKLGVSTRAAAVARARSLRLVS